MSTEDLGAGKAEVAMDEMCIWVRLSGIYQSFPCFVGRCIGLVRHRKQIFPPTLGAW